MDPVFKKRVLEAFAADCRVRIEDAGRELALLDEAAEGETKSSAGDKYETAREMFSQARDLHRKAREEAASRLDWLRRQDPSLERTSVGPGALVRVDGSWFLPGPVPFSVIVDGDPVQGASMQGPLGLALKGARAGERRAFREREVLVEFVL